MIGEIRDKIDELHAQGRFELVREVMGGIDWFNFSNVPDKTVSQIWNELTHAYGQKD